jgi:predicted Zn-dependent protease
MKKTKIPVILFLILTSFLFYCATTGPEGKKSLILISTDQEISIGKQFADEVDSTNRISEDKVLQSYVNDIGQKIAKLSDRPNLEYHFSVIDTPIVNAFACPGGFIYVYTGLLKIMDNEAQLSGVLSHEISHVVARHSVKRLQQILGVQVLLSIALRESSELTKNAVNTGIGVVLQGYSRENEFEADKYGTYYMTQAGYNPEGMHQLLEKLQELSKENPGFFEKLMATHPPTQERIREVNNLVDSYGPETKKLPYGQQEYQKMKSRLK